MGKYFCILTLLISLIVSCKPKEAAPANEQTDNSAIHVTREQFDNMKMEIGSLQEQDFNQVVRVRGIVDAPPKSKARVSSVVSGFVKEIFIQQGDKVREGQALLSIEGPEIIRLQQSFLEISEQLKYLQSEYERQKILHTEKIASEKKYLEAESIYKKEMANYEGLKQQLLLLHINIEKLQKGQITPRIVLYAPISGDITMVHVNINMVISPSDILAEIIDTNQLLLNLSVFEKDVLNLKPGQKVIFTLSESSGKAVTATVRLINKAVESSDRTVHIQAVPDDSVRQSLLYGMYVDAGIITGSRKVWAIPADALIVEGMDNYVLFLKNSDNNGYEFLKIPVHPGERSGNNIEIIPDNEVTVSGKLLIKGVYDVK